MLTALILAAAVTAPKPPPPTPLPRPFGRGDVSYHPTTFAPYTFDNTIVRVHFDFAHGIVYGHETAIVRPKRDGLRALQFNTLGITYSSVTVNGKSAAYTFDKAKQLVNVRAPANTQAGTRLAVDFTYTAQPQRGIYFIRPDKGYPDVTPEIWSQGEMIDNRRCSLLGTSPIRRRPAS